MRLSLLLPTPTKGRKHRGRQRRRTGHNLLLRLSTRKEDALRFLADPDVPFTNNQAEQDGRMMKVKQKISGGFRSDDGANTFVINRTVISTAKKARVERPADPHPGSRHLDQNPQLA